MHLRSVLFVVKYILVIAAVTFTTARLAHSGAECYHNGRRLYVPDGLNYPCQAWASWGISCRTPEPAIAAGSGPTIAYSQERPAEWCGWWMRQHLGEHYGPEFNVARNWLNAGRPLDGPRPGAIGVKAHHVFQVVQVIDPEHVLAISGNDHNAVTTRIRPTSDVIGWRDVSEEAPASNETAAEEAVADLSIAAVSLSLSSSITALSGSAALSAAALSAAVLSAAAVFSPGESADKIEVYKSAHNAAGRAR